ncbi:peptidyl-prolyl cis-trans isomerase [Candidatus Dependentiae bacterium]|nr:peptidyl-prolyl cis-trans isomerase [Candidatus Dependentiae bacterium]
MKLINIQKLFVCIVLPGILQAEHILIDQIKVVICGPQNNIPLTDTDETFKRGIDNKFMQLNPQIQKQIVNEQIIAERLPIEPDAAKKYIEGIRKQNNFSDSDLTDLFAGLGRTYQEGLDFLTTQYNNEFFLHYKFKSQLAPTEEEICEYYDQNPEFVDAFYKIRGTRIGYDVDTKDQLKKDLEEMIQKEYKDKQSDIEWSEPLIVSADDIPLDKQFLVDMKQGDIKLIQADGSFEIYQLIEYTPMALVPLEERKTAIVDILNRGKLERMLADYNKSVQEYVGLISFE